MDLSTGILKLKAHYGWGYRELAEKVDASPYTVRNWAEGMTPKRREHRERLEELIATLPVDGEPEEDAERNRLLRDIGSYANNVGLDDLRSVAADLKRRMVLALAPQYRDEIAEVLALEGGVRVTESGRGARRQGA